MCEINVCYFMLVILNVKYTRYFGKISWYPDKKDPLQDKSYRRDYTELIKNAVGMETSWLSSKL